MNVRLFSEFFRSGGAESGPEQAEDLAGPDERNHRVRLRPALQGGGQLQPERQAAADGPDRPVQRRHGQPARYQAGSGSEPEPETQPHPEPEPEPGPEPETQLESEPGTEPIPIESLFLITRIKSLAANSVLSEYKSNNLLMC